jgi:hypothetical protein
VFSSLIESSLLRCEELRLLPLEVATLLLER